MSITTVQYYAEKLVSWICCCCGVTSAQHHAV